MKNIIFIAPPAAGKGTQSDLLVEKYNYNHISTGNLLRAEIAAGGDLSQEINDIIATGNLVGDDIVSKLLENKLKTEKGPFIFDGYPRNIEQADNLERILNELSIDLGFVVFLNVSEEEAIRRATGRMLCPKCNRSYHIYDEVVKPSIEGKCDVCKIDLTQRVDDTIDAYKERYKNYIKNTEPLLMYYKEKGKIITIDNPTTPEDTFSQIEKVII